jgi:hypothetical protein
MVGLRERGLHISGTLADAHGYVRAECRMDGGCVFLHSCMQIEQWGQGLVVHRDTLYCIPSYRRILGHHHSDGLTDVTGFVLRQQRVLGRA